MGNSLQSKHFTLRAHPLLLQENRYANLSDLKSLHSFCVDRGKLNISAIPSRRACELYGTLWNYQHVEIHIFIKTYRPTIIHITTAKHLQHIRASWTLFKLLYQKFDYLSDNLKLHSL